ncbi:MAG: hypothetical protein HQ507_04170 [Candidatus Marinimicrobia bacterium]|nr:hypothetical protein [Candidatus Neomarinimicrobiota bacterium]
MNIRWDKTVLRGDGLRPFGLGVNSKFTWGDARKKFELCNAGENRGRTTIDICVIGMFNHEDPHSAVLASDGGIYIHACFSMLGIMIPNMLKREEIFLTLIIIILCFFIICILDYYVFMIRRNY